LKRKKQPYHLAQLSHLDNNEAHKLLKQASKMRKLALSKGGRKASISDFLNELVPLAQEPRGCAIVMPISMGIASQWVTLPGTPNSTAG
jgi:hypothetical protein